MKTYTTYARLYYKGEPQGRVYLVRVKASSQVEANRKADTYHRRWNLQSKKIKSDRGYSIKRVDSPRRKPKRRSSPLGFNFGRSFM